MPNPIPEWDVARRVVKYVGVKQIKGEDVLVRSMCVTVGLGRERIEKILQEHQIIYHIIVGEDNIPIIFLEHVPPTLVADAGVLPKDLIRSYQEYRSGTRGVYVKPENKLKKREKQNQRVRDFWDRPKGEE